MADKIIGLQMQWDDQYGTEDSPSTHMESFWMRQEDLQGAASISMRFRGWHDKAAYEAGKQSIAEHSFVVTSIEQFPTISSWDDLNNYKYQAVLAADPFFADADPIDADGQIWSGE